MANVKSFPVKISCNSSLYSLSILVGNCLKPFSKTKILFEDYKTHIESILETKLYWTLLRAFKDKIYLYI